MAAARRLFPFDQSNSQSQCQQFRGKRGKPNPIAAQQDRQTENSRRFYSNHQNWRHTAGRGAFSAAEAPKTQEALMAFKFLGQRQLGKLPSRWVSTILMVAIESSLLENLLDDYGGNISGVVGNCNFARFDRVRVVAV